MNICQFVFNLFSFNQKLLKIYQQVIQTVNSFKKLKSQMNFSAKLKSTQQPNYIFNFNIDIPVKYKSLISHRSNQTSPSKSPGKLNYKKYKISSITPRPVGLSMNMQNGRKIQKVGNKSNKKNTKIPKTMKQQFLQKDLYQIKNFNTYNNEKKPQASISRKTQKISNVKNTSRKQQICPSRRTVKNSSFNNINENLSKKNVVRNISILQKLITDDNIIKYTTDSSQIKRTQPSNPIYINNIAFKFANKNKNAQFFEKSERVATFNDEFNIKEIRQYEELATQRKQKLNYEYLKEKFLVQSSVRKIQRAWKKYLTKKLVTSYSSVISSKLTSNLIIASARSQPRSCNILKTKKQFKSNELYIFPDKKETNKFKNRGSSSESQKQSLQNQDKSQKVFKKSNLFYKKSNFGKGQGQANFFKNKKVNQKLIQQKVSSQQSQIQQNLLKLSKSKSSKQQQINLQKNLQKRKNEDIMKQKQFSNKKSSKQSSSVSQQSFIDDENPIKSERQRQRQVQDKLKKFQEQEIRKWQSILESIKKGKNIEVLLQKSQKYKQELENNLKLINISNNINKHRASPIIFKSSSSKKDLHQSDLSFKSQTHSLVRKTSSKNQKLNNNYLSESSQKSVKLLNSSSQNQLRKIQNDQEQLNETAQKRKEKIMFFENEILKIDNQDYSDISSVQSFNQLYPTNANNNNNLTQPNDLQQRQKEQNMKLRKKLQLFNTHFLDISSEEGLTDRSLKGLKSNSTDQRRNYINKRMNQLGSKVEVQNQNQENKQPPSSEEGRKYRRPDITIDDSQIQKQKQREKQKQKERPKERGLSKIQQLINKKIQYPEQEEDQNDDQGSELMQIDGDEINFQSNHNYIDDSDQSQQNQRMNEINFQGHEKHFYNQHFYAQPVLTHRQRRLQVPELKLQNIKKKNDEKVTLIQKVNSEEISSDIIKIIQNHEIILNSQIKEKQTFSSQTHSKTQQKQKQLSLKVLPKMSMDQILKICSYLQQELVYESLLQFSDSDKIVQNIKNIFDNFKKEKKKVKPQGICTNLQSIKDYLENFVGFIFQNKMDSQLQNTLWTSTGPKVQDLLKYLRKDYQQESQQNQYIMNIENFEKHWRYANANIYFDKKYNDQKTQSERVIYLKGLTRVYFRAIFDAFNQSLQFQRAFGLTGQPYPWCNKVAKQSRKTLKTAFQLAYRRILKISVVYYGVHFDDKTHLFNEESIRELQQQRLLTLLIMELEEEEYRWNFIEDQLAEIKYDMSLMIENEILQEFLKEFKDLNNQ